MVTRSNALRSLLTICSLCFCFVMAASAQDSAPKTDPSAKLAAETQKIKEQIAKIGQGQDVSIIRRDGQEYYGSISTIGEDSIIVSEANLKANVEISYQQIKTISKGYGIVKGKSGKRISIPKNIGRIALIWVITAAVVVGIAAIVLSTIKD